MCPPSIPSSTNFPTGHWTNPREPEISEPWGVLSCPRKCDQVNEKGPFGRFSVIAAVARFSWSLIKHWGQWPLSSVTCGLRPDHAIPYSCMIRSEWGWRWVQWKIWIWRGAPLSATSDGGELTVRFWDWCQLVRNLTKFGTKLHIIYRNWVCLCQILTVGLIRYSSSL